jgi:hypothetical protein
MTLHRGLIADTAVVQVIKAELPGAGSQDRADAGFVLMGAAAIPEKPLAATVTRVTVLSAKVPADRLRQRERCAQRC